MYDISTRSEKKSHGCRLVIAVGFASALLLVPAGSMRHGWMGLAASDLQPAASRAAAEAVSPAAAQALEDKMRALQGPVLAATRSLAPVAITEAEANSYLKYRGGRFLPPAVHDPELHITSEHVSGEADVDFNELNQGTKGTAKAAPANDWAARALSSIFAGKQRVAATGKLDTADGQGRVTIESVTIGSVTVPPVLVDWLLQNYVAKRYNIDLSKPFTLPDHVTHIELSAGRALFVRRPGKGK